MDFAMDELKPDFFVWLGDNTGHNVWEDGERDHLKSMRDITERFMVKYGKLGDMYPILGNHEGQPCDEFDVYSTKHQWILNNATDYWRSWFTPECKQNV